MPLPDANIEWPPPECKPAHRLYREHGAWYSGDVSALSTVYGVGSSVVDPRDHIRPDQSAFSTGLFGRLRRWFWGQPPAVNQAAAKLHVPLAADIASTSADLLYGEPPALVVDDPTTQQRLDKILTDGGVYSALHEAGEIASAYGGAYVRVCWDRDVADMPLVDVVCPDVAVPEWRHGRLSAVTLWSEVTRDSGDVWRWLERHERGRVLHGLYKGTDERLGRPQPLDAHPATEGYAEHVDDQGAITTGAKRLAVRYLRNIGPNRTLRGSPLGRSDYAGIEPVLDSLDEAWTSWMRDLRLGKARIVVPDAYLQSQGRGRGARWDPEQEVYSTLNMLPRPDAPGSMITPVQFKIRVEEHERTTRALTAEAVRGAGYSEQTFGGEGDVAATATEVVARNARSYTTRGKKIGYQRPELAALAEVLLQVDAAQFGTAGIVPQRPTIEWPDGVAVDPEAQARTLQMLDAAGAISTETKVKILHPEWDAAQVRGEVTLIRADHGAALPDPADTLGGFAGNEPGDQTAPPEG